MVPTVSNAVQKFIMRIAVLLGFFHLQTLIADQLGVSVPHAGDLLSRIVAVSVPLARNYRIDVLILPFLLPS